MKLSKLYSNRPRLFEPVIFDGGLNVVMAEIRLPENRDRDTHNLGKTTLGWLLNFSLLDGRNPEFFLFKHEELFKEFVFFLELQLFDGSFLTIRRGVNEASKISFKKHAQARQDFSQTATEEWDHLDIPFDRARALLDGLLDLRAVAPWDFRQGLGYLLRLQDDYQDVFKLSGFLGKHVFWKPYLAHVLGFNAGLIKSHYQKEDELKTKEILAETIKRELGSSTEGLSKIEGVLLLKTADVEKKQALLDTFDFRNQDKAKTKQLVDQIDERIAALNSQRYSLSKARKKITVSLEEDQIFFRPDEAEKLFVEVGIFFAGQIKKDFEQLISFNKEITEERRRYLAEERSEVDAELKRVTSELNELGKQRINSLSYLSSTDVFAKYKQITDELVVLKADITSLDRQRSHLHRLQELGKEIRTITEEKDKLREAIEEDVQKQNDSTSKSFFSNIRLFFSEIVEDVIGRKALLSVRANKEGHLEFKAEILDEHGNTTSADQGHTYRKLLCVAFDMAVLRAHFGKKFPQFVYHDGIFESLDDRKKANLLEVIRQYNEYGLQHIITLIDSELPKKKDDDAPVFESDEIVLLLHDEGDNGRLFKMKSW